MKNSQSFLLQRKNRQIIISQNLKEAPTFSLNSTLKIHRQQHQIFLEAYSVLQIQFSHHLPTQHLQQQPQLLSLPPISRLALVEQAFLVIRAISHLDLQQQQLRHQLEMSLVVIFIVLIINFKLIYFILNSGANKENQASPFANAPSFGSAFGKSSEDSKNNIFASSTSTFSFAEAAKELDKSKDDEKPSPTPGLMPDFLTKTNSFGGFAEIAAKNTDSPSNTGVFSGNFNNSGSFFGLTVKDDFFSKNLNKQNNSEADSSQNDNEGVNDENYDPHYDPIISLPDEIQVSTGEEEEEKLFGERAKLYRYDTKTREWKERGELLLKFKITLFNNSFKVLVN